MPTKNDFIVGLTTIGGDEEAVVLARALLERRLVACVNIVPSVRSLYWWKGAIEDDSERLLLMKTRADRKAALLEALSELHPYDVPELICLPVTAGSPAYLDWLGDSLKRG